LRRFLTLSKLSLPTLLLLAACSLSPPSKRPVDSQATRLPASGLIRTESPANPTHVPIPPQGDLTTITFAVDEYALPAFEALVGAFHAAHPTIRVVVLDVDQVKGNWLQFAPTPAMMNELASSVDVFLLPESSLLVGLDSGALLDLTPLADGDPSFQADDFFPGILDHFRRQGRLWALPAGVGETLIFYNRGLFDATGVPYPAPGWTWDQFLDAVIRLTNGEGNTKQYGFVDAWGGQGLIPFIQQHGGDLLDRDAADPAPALDDPPVVEAVQWYVDLVFKHGVSPADDELQGMIPHDVILDRRAAMWTDALSNWAGLSTRLGSSVGIAPFPEDRTAANPVSLTAYYVSAGTSRPQACWQWISFLTRQHVLQEFGEKLPARRSVLAESEYFQRMGEADRAAIRYALEHPAPRLTAYDVAIMGPLFQALDDVWAGSATVEVALAQAQVEAEEQVAIAIAGASAAPTPPPVRPVPSPTAEQAPIALTFFAGEGPAAASYQAWADLFNTYHPEASVTVEPGTPLDFGGTAGSADCFVWPTFARSADWQQHVVPLQPFIDAQSEFTLDDLYPQALAGLSLDGELWGLPLQVAPELLYFNRDLFDAAGLPYPEAEWAWIEFAAAAGALTTGEDQARRYGFVPSASFAPEALAFVAQRGASLVDDVEHPTLPTFHTQAAIEALEWYAGLASAMPPLWAEDDPYAASAERAALIRAGRAAMWTASPWSGDPGYDFAVGAVPLPGDRRQATDFDTWAVYVSAYSPHPRACWDWLTYLSDHLVAGPGVPARRSLAEEMPLDSEAEFESAASLASMDHASIRLDRWQDRTVWLGWVYPWFRRAVRDVLAGQQSPSEALATVQAQAEEFLSCLAAPGEALDEREARRCARQVDPGYPSAPGQE
jgi:ABC-type glycerol-3-phosphate transport system substrate-binding protein